MNKLIALFVLIGIAAVCAVGTELEQRNKFQLFKQTFGKSYASSAEEQRRFRTFQNNLAIIEEKNRRFNPKTQFGITKFADLSKQEFKDLYLMREELLAPLANGKAARVPRVSVPDNFDWNNKTGVVTPVKDQGQCGSCWDFSATETMESVWALAGHQLIELSEQQTVDCDTTDYGCDGGWPYNAYKYVIGAGGVETEKAYPYTATDGTCHFDAAKVAAKFSSWQYVVKPDDHNEETMRNFLYSNSPLSVCVDAEEWQFYTGGVMTAAACGDSIDHCVQATGWTTFSDGSIAWNVRNSWNTNWGDNGYIWVEYGKDACAIAEVVTVPVV